MVRSQAVRRSPLNGKTLDGRTLLTIKNTLRGSLILLLAAWIARLAWANDPSDADREKARLCHEKNAALRPEFDKAVAANGACTKSSDCAVLTPGCPFGCYVAVARMHAVEVERLPHELVGRAPDCRCMYKCTARPRASCVRGNCTIESRR
jgi:hypothetical protein